VRQNKQITTWFRLCSTMLWRCS